MDRIYTTLALLAFLCAVVQCQVTPDLNIIIHHPAPAQIFGKQILAKQGDILEMECTVDRMPPKTRVQWFLFPKGSQSVVPISDGHLAHDQNKYKVERGQEAENSYKLTVQALQLSDSGDYQCKALYDAFATPISETYSVEVNIPPYISSARSSTDTEAKSGDEINLECSAEGVPKPDVTWRRAGGQPLPTGGEYHSNHLLTIRDMKPEYRGHYICDAVNKIGKARLQIYVDMKFKPAIEVREKEAFQKPGYVKDLICSITGNPMPSIEQVTWTKDGKPIDNTVDPDRIFVKFARGKSTAETRLSIRPVRESDFGTYRCTAVNPQNQAAYASIKLSETDIPTSSLTGMIVEGNGCQATSVYIATFLASLVTSLVANLHRIF